MKKYIILYMVVSLSYSIGFPQNKPGKDTTISLPTDIYSKNSTVNNDRTNSNSFIIGKEQKDSNSIKILSVGYNETINLGDKFYKNKDFSKAAFFYLKAFKNNNDLGKVDDRLKTACCFSMLNNTDSAFIQLFRIVSKGNYTNLNELNSIEYLKPLHKDKRWQEVIELINKNRAQLIEKLNAEIPENEPKNESDH